MHRSRSGWLNALLVLTCFWVSVYGRAALACLGCPLGQPYFVTVPGTEQISNGIITIVTQDQRGLTWIGTPEGLLSFDGYQLRRYRHDPTDPQSLGDDYVRALLAHSDGRLWVATQGAGLSIYDPQTDRFVRHSADGSAHGLPNNATITLLEGHAGEVWIGLGSAGLVRHDPATGQFQTYRHDPADASGLRDNTVRSLLLDRRGDLWLGTGNGLQRRDAEHDRFVDVLSQPGSPDGFDRQYVYSLFEASDGRIWIGTQSDGVAVHDPVSGGLQRFAVGGEALSHPWVSGFAEATPGRIWVFTYGGGIDVIDAASLRVVQHIRSDAAIPGGLALNRLVAPFQDRSGLVWVGTWGAGLQVHNPLNAATFVTHRQHEGNPAALRSANVFSTLAVGPTTVWIGTERGIDEFDLQRGRLRAFSPDPKASGALRDGTIRAMAKTADGNIWVGTQQTGLQRYRAETGDFSEPLQLPRNVTIRRLLGSVDGSLWIGLQGGLLRLDPTTLAVRELGFAVGQPLNDPVWSLVEDRDRNLWIGTPNQLLLLRPDAPWLEVISNSLAPLRALTDLQIGPDGRLWCSGPRGIARLTGWQDGAPQFEDYGRRLGELPQGLGQVLQFDEHGRLWSPQALLDPALDRLYPLGTADGIDIGSVATGSGSKLGDGRLLFGGTRGLLVIDPRQYSQRLQQAPLLVTGLEIDGRPSWLASSTSGFELPPDAGRFTLSYAALDYSAAPALRYAHRLVGLDRQWIENDAGRRVATYTNLWPGAYSMEIKARQAPGDWSEVLRVPVQVLPAWWQTWWALLVAVLSLLLLSVWIVRWRTLRIQHRAQLLEVLVEQRTAELTRAKEHAESTLSELRGAQRQLVAAEKMASLGQLVAGVAHEINTPIGIAVTAASHLQEFSRRSAELLEAGQLSRSKLRDWERDVEEGSALILGSLQRAATLIAGFKQVSVDQSSDQRRKFQLHSFLEEVRLALRPSLRGSTQELHIDCPAGIEVDTYPGALFQVLTNLVNNAHTHAFEPGQAGQMRVSVREDGPQVLLRFADDGRGMDSATAARAFDPFFTTRRGSGGSGLGLHIVHNLVTQLLGGTIELSTSPGSGAQLDIRLPRRAPDRSES